jgi:8-oxo-dGTP pyrophosphatase MutT (NUDIX family)
MTAQEKGNNTKTPKQASTVILAREQLGELQIYLLRRSGRSSFMPGNYVFPGGRVDREDRDRELWKGHADMALKAISRRLGDGLGEEEALGHAVAAIRETFEEAGVFLAYRDGVGREDIEAVCERPMNGDLPQGWFHEWTVSGDWTLAISWLAPWAHWITPKVRLQRYDTRFFLAFMPDGQECAPDAKETTHGIWISPEKALKGNLRKEIPLSPPGLVTMHELLEYSSREELERETVKRSWGDTRMPQLVPLQGEALILLPWDSMYNQDVEIHAEDLENRVLPIGKPFSRLWYHDGIWRPVLD